MAKNIHIMDYPFLRTQKKEFDSTTNAIFRLEKKDKILVGLKL